LKFLTGLNIVTLFVPKGKRNGEHKAYLNEETILCLLDEIQLTHLMEPMILQQLTKYTRIPKILSDPIGGWALRAVRLFPASGPDFGAGQVSDNSANTTCYQQLKKLSMNPVDFFDRYSDSGGKSWHDSFSEMHIKPIYRPLILHPLLPAIKKCCYRLTIVITILD